MCHDFVRNFSDVTDSLKMRLSEADPKHASAQSYAPTVPRKEAKSGGICELQGLAALSRRQGSHPCVYSGCRVAGSEVIISAVSDVKPSEEEVCQL
jgi:hypothetical protein